MSLPSIPVDTGTHHGIHWALCTAPLYGAINGYAQLPEGHPWRDQGLQMGIDGGPDVHGGITYGPAPDGWIGFDFLHAGDHWPGSPIPAFPRDAERTKADVLCEALNLCEQIAVTRREAGTRTAHGLEPVAERVVMRSRKPGYLGALILHGYDELGPFSLEFAVNPEEGVTLEYDAEVTR